MGSKKEFIERTKEITDWFYSLDAVPCKDALIETYKNLPLRVRQLKSGNADKYLRFTSVYPFEYRFTNGSHAYGKEFLPKYVRIFLADVGGSVVIPSYGYVDGLRVVYRLTFRSVFRKEFRFFSPLNWIPHGMLHPGKTVKDPWIVVESAIDADWLRDLYPFVIATGGVSGLGSYGMWAIANTANVVVISLDNDSQGCDGADALIRGLRKANPYIGLATLQAPSGCKDFGDILDARIRSEDTYQELRSMVQDRLSALGLR